MTRGWHRNSERASILGLLWRRFAFRHWLGEPGTTVVLVSILSLGVAVFLAVRLANKAAVTGFAFFTESVAGESDLLLRSGAGELDSGILPDLRSAAGDDPVEIFPVLEVSAADVEGGGNSILRIVGVDLVALQNTAEASGEVQSASFSDGGSVLGRSGIAFVGTEFSEKRRLGSNDWFSVVVNDRQLELQIEAVLPDNPNRPRVPDNLILMDLPGLQKAIGEAGTLSRVEFRIPSGSDRDLVLARVEDNLDRFASERELILQTPEDRKASVTTMSAAFRMNLAILSGLALVVGIYLIFQAMEAAVIKRRSEIAVMRSLGVTPLQVRWAWLAESLILGIVGSVAGILLGWILARALVGGIARTVNTIYYQTTTDAVFLSPVEVVFSLFFGIAASVVAGFIPAREAAATPPAQAMRQGVQGGGLAILRNAPLGVVLAFAGIACAWISPLETEMGTTVPVGGYLASMFFVVGFSILIGVLFSPVARLLRNWKSDPMRSYAASQLMRPRGRHRLTSAGLAVAIGMSAAMGILVASFEHTLTSWIGHLLKADIYVAAAGESSVANENTISADTWRGIERVPGVSGMDRLRRYTITLEGREVFLCGSDYNDDPDRYLQLIWREAPDDPGPRALERTVGALPVAWVSEPFARRFQMEKGDSVVFPTPAGRKTAVISGVYADYGNEAGTILLSRSRIRDWFVDDNVSNIAVYVDPGADSEAVLETIRESYPTLVARTNSNLRSESLRIFHQTFAVTYALEAIAVIIAVTGLGLALTGLLLERKTELTTLRTLGATRSDIARSAMWESVGVAIVGLVGGFAMSFLLGWVLIDVINPQSFGWTLEYRIPWRSFAGVTIATTSIAALVGWFVGKRTAGLRSDKVE